MERPITDIVGEASEEVTQGVDVELFFQLGVAIGVCSFKPSTLEEFEAYDRERGISIGTEG